ncbi:PKD domain-containing protein [Halobaculum rarum]|uniref:PKD domain-containing protein n=1 Tax=Halobaculum rarum TaxID=3075122 RepID=UPI0032B018C4
MIGRRRTLTVVVVLLVAGVGAFSPVTSADGSAVGFSQNGACYSATPYGNGSETVVDYYDYRYQNGAQYSSYGTTDLQQSQVSQLFIYRGSDGLSLVFLHDKLGDGELGGTITFDITGLPADGVWAERDDYYGSGTDDNWELGETTAHIDWVWAPGRSDGAAFRGLDSEEPYEIVIRPGFNEDADRYASWRWGQNETEAWILRTSTSDTVELSMDDPVTITPSCGPDAVLDAPSTVEIGHEVTLDAGGSTDDEGIVEYRWDVDGDGVTDETTSTATYTHTYHATGTVEPHVTVVDDDGQTDTASVSIEVEDTTPPKASLDAPTSVTVDDLVTVSGADSTDNVEIVSYEWSFGDGTTATGATANHTYDEPGTYSVTLTVTDAADNTDSVTETITVEESASDSKTIAEAVASTGPGDDTQISRQEVQKAIFWWQTDQAVPDTGGETINRQTLQRLIYLWQTGATVDGS